MRVLEPADDVVRVIGQRDPRRVAAADVLDLLEQQVAAVRTATDAGPLEKARTVGYLAAITLKAIEAGDMAAQVEALEAVLKRRNGDGGR